MKLVGTTKTTIAAVKDRTHWNAANIKPVDPVSLGLCSQLELDLAVQKAARKSGRATMADAAEHRTLIPAAEVAGTAANRAAMAAAEAEKPAAPVREEEKQYAIPNDAQHMHFGGGQTETVLQLPAGQHTLQLVFGDLNHELHKPNAIMSEKITITVR